MPARCPNRHPSRKSMLVGRRRWIAPWAAVGARAGPVAAMGMRRPKRFAGAIGARHDFGVDEAVVETALDGNRLTRLHQVSAFAARPGFHQRAAAIVPDDELVAEDFGDLSLYRDGTGGCH